MGITKLIDLVAEVAVQKTLAPKRQETEKNDAQSIGGRRTVAKSRLAFQIFLRDHLLISSLPL